MDIDQSLSSSDESRFVPRPSIFAASSMMDEHFHSLTRQPEADNMCGLYRDVDNSNEINGQTICFTPDLSRCASPTEEAMISNISEVDQHMNMNSFDESEKILTRSFVHVGSSLYNQSSNGRNIVDVEDVDLDSSKVSGGTVNSDKELRDKFIETTDAAVLEMLAASLPSTLPSLDKIKDQHETGPADQPPKVLVLPNPKTFDSRTFDYEDAGAHSHAIEAATDTSSSNINNSPLSLLKNLRGFWGCCTVSKATHEPIHSVAGEQNPQTETDDLICNDALAMPHPILALTRSIKQQVDTLDSKWKIYVAFVVAFFLSVLSFSLCFNYTDNNVRDLADTFSAHVPAEYVCIVTDTTCFSSVPVWEIHTERAVDTSTNTEEQVKTVTTKYYTFVNLGIALLITWFYTGKNVFKVIFQSKQANPNHGMVSEEIEHMQLQSENLQSENKHLQAENLTLRQMIEVLEQRLTIQKLTKQLKKSKANEQTLPSLNEEALLQDTKHALESKAGKTEKELDQARAEVLSLHESLRLANKIKDTLQSEREEYKAEVEALKKVVSDITHHLEAVNAEKDEMAGIHTEFDSTVSTLRSERASLLQALDEKISENEGLNEIVDAVNTQMADLTVQLDAANLENSRLEEIISALS